MKQVILIKDVDTLGERGDVLRVSEGYARNYLFPKQMAIPATTGALQDREVRIERIHQQAEKKHAEDLEKSKQVETVGTIAIEANAGDSGKLYGAITTKELAAILNEKTKLDLQRKQLNVSAPINQVGDYTLYVKFSSRVSVSVDVRVTATAKGERQSIIEDVVAAEQEAVEQEA